MSRVVAITAGGGIALVAGLPLGRTVGLFFGWRVTFGVLGLLALLILIGLLRFLPEITQEQDDESRKKMLRNIVNNRSLMMIYLITAVIITGHYTGYSYIEPFMDRILKMDATAITYTLCLFGIAGIVGSYVMKRCYQRHPAIMIRTACICLPAAMLFLLPASDFGIIPLSALCILWGLALTIYNIAFQSEVMEQAPYNKAVAMSIYIPAYLIWALEPGHLQAA